MTLETEHFQTGDAPATRADLTKLEGKLERRFGVRLLILVIIMVTGLAGLGLVLDQRDENRDSGESAILSAIQTSQVNLELVLATAGRNTERTCSIASGTAVLFRVLAEEADLVTPRIEAALADLEASVADGCEEVDAESPSTPTTPDG